MDNEFRSQVDTQKEVAFFWYSGMSTLQVAVMCLHAASPRGESAFQAAVLSGTAVVAGMTQCTSTDKHESQSRACCAQLLVAERGPLVFVFNFSPFNDYADYKVRAQYFPAPLA